MIKLTAEIRLTSTTGQALDSLSSNLLGNNISAEIGAIKGIVRNTRNPFIFGRNKLGDGSTFSSGENYFIGNQFTDSSGLFANSYTITISGTNIDHFTIMFDKANGVFPTEIKVDGVTFYDNDAQFTVANLSSANTHTVVIEKLNKPNAQLIITGLYIGITILLDYKALNSIEVALKDRHDIEKPDFGIVSTNGTINFADIDKQFADYVKLQLLKSNLSADITLSDTLTKKSEMVGSFLTDKWNYDNDNGMTELTLKDDLLEWQGILVDKTYIQGSKSMEYMYNYLHNLTPSKYKMKAFAQLDNDTKSILTNTICSYTYLERGSLWNAWQKLCETCGLYIYKNSNGDTTCVYAFRS